jgi:hypothetical protein
MASREHPASTHVGEMPQVPVPGRICVRHVLPLPFSFFLFFLYFFPLSAKRGVWGLCNAGFMEETAVPDLAALYYTPRLQRE